MNDKNKKINYLKTKVGYLPSFSELKYSATTIILTLDQDIDYDTFYEKIPIVDIEIVEGKENRKKIDLNFVKLGTPGTIFSAKYKKNNVVKNKGYNRTGKNSFGNSLTCDMHLTNKNINFKITRNKIHITGCKEDDNIKELFKYIKIYIQCFMDEGVYVCEQIPTIISINRALIKMDYNIGFCINRAKLDEYIRRSGNKSGFQSFYDPGLDQSVLISHPIIDENNRVRRKSSLDYDIKVRFNGSVLFCGNDYAEMAQIYVKFNTLLLKIRDEIELFLIN